MTPGSREHIGSDGVGGGHSGPGAYTATIATCGGFSPGNGKGVGTSYAFGRTGNGSGGEYDDTSPTEQSCLPMPGAISALFNPCPDNLRAAMAYAVIMLTGNQGAKT